MSVVVVQGKTVEEAVDNACSQMRVSRDKVRYIVLESPKKGFMGIFGSRKARVQVEAISVTEEISLFLQQTVKKMGIGVTMTMEEKAEREWIFQFTGADLALLIGKNGQTLESLQYLVNRIFCSGLKKQKVKVYLDANGYRKRKEKFLEGLAHRMGELVLRTKKRIALDPMSASERKLIHGCLQDKTHLRTESVGIEPERYVVIHWKA